MTRLGNFGETQDVAVTVLVDNITDMLLKSTDTVKRYRQESGEPLLAEHGLSALVDLKDARVRILWDAGITQVALEEGAELVLDGRGVQVAGYPNGYYVGPTLFDRVHPEMAIAREEIFGPVLGIIPVTDFDEALEEIIYDNPSSELRQTLRVLAWNWSRLPASM